jgi:hypothetical protein
MGLLQPWEQQPLESAQRGRGGDPVLESVNGNAFGVVKEGIYFIPKQDAAGSDSIQFFNFATKRISPISTIESAMFANLSASPDGRWILYSQTDQLGSDLMLVENFR